MSDGLSVIRRVYGPDGQAPSAGADAIETAVLTQSIDALGALPTYAPDADVLARICARAAEASDVEALAAVRGALGLGPMQATVEGEVLRQAVDALATLPRVAPAPEAVAAVEARAEEASLAPIRAASGESDEVASGPEVEILRQSLLALDTLPRTGPSEEALAAVMARAQEASLAPVRSVVGETDETVKGPEVALLRQSLQALDTLPAYAVAESTLQAVLARAAEASLAPVLAAYDEAPEASGVSPEVEILRQSREALETLPRYAPSERAVAAVLAAASAATTSASPAGRQRPAADRAAVREARPRRRTGAFAGLATLALAVIAAVVFLQPGGDTLAPEAVADQEIALATPAPSQPEPLASPSASEPDVASGPDVVSGPDATAPLAEAVPTYRRSVARSAPSGPSADAFEPVAARSSAPRSAPAAPRADAAFAGAALADAAPPRPVETEWEAAEDVQLLSLRLQQLREQNRGIEWDTPATAFGAAGPATPGTTPGVQAVREMAPVGRALVRNLAPDSNR